MGADDLDAVQRIALSLTLSALAATLVGIAEYYTEIDAGNLPSHAKMLALGFEIMLGSITVGGNDRRRGEAAGVDHVQTRDVPRAELRERPDLSRDPRTPDDVDHPPGRWLGVLLDDRRVPRLRRAARHADRRRGYASGRRVAQFVFGARVVRDRVRGSATWILIINGGDRSTAHPDSFFRS